VMEGTFCKWSAVDENADLLPETAGDLHGDALAGGYGMVSDRFDVEVIFATRYFYVKN
jgi:hypothetical protein